MVNQAGICHVKPTKNLSCLKYVTAPRHPKGLWQNDARGKANDDSKQDLSELGEFLKKVVTKIDFFPLFSMAELKFSVKSETKNPSCLYCLYFFTSLN